MCRPISAKNARSPTCEDFRSGEWFRMQYAHIGCTSVSANFGQKSNSALCVAWSRRPISARNTARVDTHTTCVGQFRPRMKARHRVRIRSGQWFKIRYAHICCIYASVNFGQKSIPVLCIAWGRQPISVRNTNRADTRATCVGQFRPRMQGHHHVKIPDKVNGSKCNMPTSVVLRPRPISARNATPSFVLRIAFGQLRPEIQPVWTRTQHASADFDQECKLATVWQFSTRPMVQNSI